MFFLFFLFNRICTSRLKLNPKLVQVQGDSIITINPNSKNQSLNVALTHLKDAVPKIVIKV